MTEAANKILSQVHEACAPYLEKIPYADKLHEVDSKTAAQIAVGALVLIPTTYYTYQVIQFFRRLRKIGREVDKLPGDPKHWLWGNLHQVSLELLQIGNVYYLCFEAMTSHKKMLSSSSLICQLMFFVTWSPWVLQLGSTNPVERIFLLYSSKAEVV